MKMVRYVFALLSVLALALTIIPVQAAQPGSLAHVPKQYYLALGDSLSVGFQTSTIPVDRNCTDTTNDATGQRGYVCLMWEKLKAIDPSIQLVDLGLAVSPGEDSCSFTSITACTGQKTRIDAAKGDQPPYDYNHESQMTAALDFLNAHKGQVSPISLDLGGNDLQPLLFVALTKGVDQAKAQLPAVLQRLETNYDGIVSKLRSAAPDADILLANQYNPVSGLPPSVLGAQGQQIESLADSALTQWATYIKTEAAKYSAIYVDVYTPFEGKGPNLTWIAFGNNVHCTGTGYKVYADTMWQAYQAAVHITPTLTVALHLAHKVIRGGHVQKFVVHTLPDAQVTIRLTYAHKHWHTKGTADSAGTFKAAWHAPHQRLLVHVRVCASLNGASTCSKTTFKVK